ncbi:MAG: leucine-rich repeat domain-containing protein [Clostridia bacterium]|nr:leucine-rich repeat domain-containing protein [Clostridia bacterium]
MKRKFLALALCLAISLFGALAVACNGEEPLTPTDESVFVINDNGVITDLTSDGKLLSTIVVPQSVQGKEVKEIGANAFKLCTQLKKVVLPEGLTTIRPYAFEKCTKLERIVIPESVTRIENYVFRNCTELKSITLSDNVTYVGSNMFYNCTSLKSVKLSNNITRIGKQMFYNCASLTSITIPAKVGQIEYNAFAGCSKLASVTIEEGVDGIQYSAFQGTAIESITIPSSIESLGDSAFASCGNLKTVNIGSGVKTLGKSVFSHCESLATITVSSDNADFKMVNSGLYSSDGKTLYAHLKDGTGNQCTVENGVEVISNGAFDGCGELEIVSLPDTVTEIQDGAFSNCENLKIIYIPQSVTTLGVSILQNSPQVTVLCPAEQKPSEWINSFGVMRPTIYNCVSGEYGIADGLVWAKTNDGLAVALYDLTLTSVVIPSTINSMAVTQIPKYGFMNCKLLESVVIPQSVVSIEGSAFFMCSPQIYCEATERQLGWQDNWNVTRKTEIYNYTQNN